LGRRIAPAAPRRNVAPDGYKFAAAPVILAAAAWYFGQHVVAVILFLLAAFVLWFFRDPNREIPADPATIVSPADGQVLIVTEENFGERAGHRISIFLAIWNVHVNRSPVAGKLAKVNYRPGKFYMAMKPAASVENEQNVISLDTPRGEIVFKQIAGLIARRVILWKKVGDDVARGERVGLVRFGSRVDLWLPLEAEILVKRGDHVAGGSSILARWPS
jgi:phosphatidylserine decarboxylase